jgi:hypothetical protein
LECGMKKWSIKVYPLSQKFRSETSVT